MPERNRARPAGAFCERPRGEAVPWLVAEARLRMQRALDAATARAG